MRAGIDTLKLTSTAKNLVFFAGDLLWQIVWGTFGWPCLVDGSVNPVWSATTRLTPSAAVFEIYEIKHYAKYKHPH